MTDLTPQEQGRAYEEEMAKKIGGRVVPGSGAFFNKLDVVGFKILWSLKHTVNRSMRVDDDLFVEIRNAIYAPGGVGPEYLGALAVRTLNHEVAAMQLDDFLVLTQRLRDLAAENEALKAMRLEEGFTEDQVSTAVSEGYAVSQGRSSFPSRPMRSRPFRR